MRATEICGEVFCEIWAVFLTVWLVVRNATLHHPKWPHFDKVNAAFRECSSVAFALVKCGVCLVEVWHSGQ